MGKYTEDFIEKTKDIYEKDDYLEELKNVMQQFRSFREALDIFISMHGYGGNLEDTESKISFFRKKFKDAGIEVPRNLKKWYLDDKGIDSDTAYKICFALGLDLLETRDFFRRIFIGRAFDCHVLKEAVYYFAIKNGLTYGECEEILGMFAEDGVAGKQVSGGDKAGVSAKETKGESNAGKQINAEDIADHFSEAKSENAGMREVVYTQEIVSELDGIFTKEDLVNYLTENREIFTYNNVTGGNKIKLLWNEIAKENGLAERERRKLYCEFDGDEMDADENNGDEDIVDKTDGKSASKDGADGNNAGEASTDEENADKNEVNEEDEDKDEASEENTEEDGVYENAEEDCIDKNYAKKKKAKRKLRKRQTDSVWEIYLQILGLAGTSSAGFYKGRSIKQILKNKNMIHPLAEASFPDRDGLTKIIHDVHVSSERVRKLFILLFFYKYWTDKALKRASYFADEEEGSRFISILNHHLTEAGYPLLYAGNPYDFIFLYAANGDAPLMIFREFMQDLSIRTDEEEKLNDESG